MSHLLLLVPCYLMENLFFQGMVTGSVLIFQEANFGNFISRKAKLTNNLTGSLIFTRTFALYLNSLYFTFYFNLTESFLAQYPDFLYFISIVDKL